MLFSSKLHNLGVKTSWSSKWRVLLTHYVSSSAAFKWQLHKTPPKTSSQQGDISEFLVRLLCGPEFSMLQTPAERETASDCLHKGTEGFLALFLSSFVSFPLSSQGLLSLGLSDSCTFASQFLSRQLFRFLSKTRRLGGLQWTSFSFRVNLIAHTEHFLYCPWLLFFFFTFSALKSLASKRIFLSALAAGKNHLCHNFIF